MYRDILVVGAGVLGLSSALHLRKINPDKSVIVIDMLNGPGQGNTSKSAGIFLNLFTTDVNYLLSDSTIDWFFHLKNDLGHRLNMFQYGYLYLIDKDRYLELREFIPTMRNKGIDVKILETEELQRMIPDLATNFGIDKTENLDLKPVEAGILGLKCGSIDTDSLARSLESEFLKHGGEVRYNTRAKKLILKPENELGIIGEPFVWQDIHVAGAETSIGEIRAETTVIAAGVWSERLLDPIGLDCFMRAKNRAIFVFEDPNLERLQNASGFNDYHKLPFTQIPEINVYLKVEPAEGSIWLGCADDFGREYGLEDDPKPERGLYLNDIYYALIKYFPCFKDLRPVNAWAGQRAINRFDRTPVVFPAPGMIYVGSATGYGITKSDALGRTVAAVYSGEADVELYGGRCLRATDLGIERRSVGREAFKV